jgi:choline monooxygenase
MEKSQIQSSGSVPNWYARHMRTKQFGAYFGSTSSIAIGEVYLTFDRRHIVHRMSEDEFFVYENACAHAGAPLLTKPGVQDVRTLVCPIHMWSYHLNGDLKRAPMFRPCEGVQLKQVPFTIWNGMLLGFEKDEVDYALKHFGESLGLPSKAFDVAEFVFMSEEDYRLRYPAALMLVNYLDILHVIFMHFLTFALVASTDTSRWEFSNFLTRLGYSIQLVRSHVEVEKRRVQAMQSRSCTEEDTGWATFHLWLKEHLGNVKRPIDENIFAVWATIYGKSCIMPELYEGGLCLAVSYLVNEDPNDPMTGNANLVEYYLHKSVPEELRVQTMRRFQHAYEQSAREDDAICERLWEAHQHELTFHRHAHEELEAGDEHYRKWYMKHFVVNE